MWTACRAHKQAPLPRGIREVWIESVVCQTGIWHPAATGLDAEGSLLRGARLVERDEEPGAGSASLNHRWSQSLPQCTGVCTGATGSRRARSNARCSGRASVAWISTTTATSRQILPRRRSSVAETREGTSCRSGGILKGKRRATRSNEGPGVTRSPRQKGAHLAPGPSFAMPLPKLLKPWGKSARIKRRPAPSPRREPTRNRPP
jgi:hypothetical protein